MEPVWSPKSLKVGENIKNECPDSSLGKSVLPDLPRSVPRWVLCGKYHMIGEVARGPFERLLGSFWIPFGVAFSSFLAKGVHFRAPNTLQKIYRKFVKKGLASHTMNWVCSPLRETRRGDPGTPRCTQGPAE